MRDNKRFEVLAGPMSPEEFMTGEYPEVKMRKGLKEFEAVLQTASSISLIRKEFQRIFGGQL